MKKKKNILFIVSLIVLILAISGIVIYLAVMGSRAKKYEDIAEIAKNTEVTTTQAPTTAKATAETTETAETTTEETTKPKPDIPIDFEALWEINPDIYAWITIPGTNIDYPILHSSEDNPDYYLEHTVYHEQGLPGAIYTQSNYNKDLETDNLTVIYGHRMLDKTMFGPFEKFWDEDFRNEHSWIIIYTPDHIYHYLLAFAVTFDDRHLLNTYDGCKDPETYAQFRRDIQDERLLPSWIHYDFENVTDQRMIVLSTCNGIDDQRILVGAVLLNEE